ncbi:5366_t:CDS:2 [Cetraspora pellucida]|uniref:5366_t:CDS:1 n=1 Tax=Cetraspora pellucida TaxID=1433469 RepID=A0A9N9HFN5_9GLOM|nr:5366_t:CDS:2 [Cetraspora pellucida]
MTIVSAPVDSVEIPEEKFKKRVKEIAQECKTYLACDRERKCHKAGTSTNLQQDKENINENKETITATSQNNDIIEISVETQH